MFTKRFLLLDIEESKKKRFQINVLIHLKESFKYYISTEGGESEKKS